MKIVDTFLLFLAAILNSVELSTQSGCFGFKDTMPLITKLPESSSQSQPIPDGDWPRANWNLGLQTSPSPLPGRIYLNPAVVVIGHPINELGFYRLVPRLYQDVKYEFRKYTFHPKAPVLLMLDSESHTYGDIPTGEQIVVVDAKEWIVAILMPNGYLRGIYYNGSRNLRSKLNLRDNEVKVMTKQEMDHFHVGPERVIGGFYIHEKQNHNSLQISFVYKQRTNVHRA